jgi:hypothetical protein
MTEEIKQDPLLKEILTFNFTVEFINAVLSELGQRPYAATAGLIAHIRNQGEPQFKILMEKEAASKNE